MSFGSGDDLSERNSSPSLLKEEIIDLCLDKSVSDHEKYGIGDVLTSIRCNNVEKLSTIIGKTCTKLSSSNKIFFNSFLGLQFFKKVL